MFPTAGELHDKAGHSHIYAVDQGWRHLLTMCHLTYFVNPSIFHLQFIFMKVCIASHT